MFSSIDTKILIYDNLTNLVAKPELFDRANGSSVSHYKFDHDLVNEIYISIKVEYGTIFITLIV